MKTRIVIDLLKYWGNHCDAHISNGEYQVEGSDLLKNAASKIERLCEDVSERNEKIGKLKKNNRKLRKELAERKAAPGWISVEERMPFAEYGESDNVLAVCAVGVIYMFYFNGSNWCYPSGVPYCPENKESKITHWMFLPEPPKKVKTYKDVFLEAFPKATITAMGRPAVCRNNIFGEGIGCKDVRCEDCWNQPYEEEGGEE